MEGSMIVITETGNPAVRSKLANVLWRKYSLSVPCLLS
jgi:hypothetical protein